MQRSSKQTVIVCWWERSSQWADWHMLQYDTNHRIRAGTNHPYEPINIGQGCNSLNTVTSSWYSHTVRFPNCLQPNPHWAISHNFPGAQNLKPVYIMYYWRSVNMFFYHLDWLKDGRSNNRKEEITNISDNWTEDAHLLAGDTNQNSWSSFVFW
jgi:hypothetical protein